ncbi:hypothetical protein BDY19DRAFT_992204 [Irpex rosettiformis]|uniref:Uncharacterized protein n=1 Tax=Irpex rosettiformis TaxID=378272 RepID=A0ACB8U8Y0_9APHY|nr:hypothetical protein BDY19DRAFT_992204 [Irpex rosettiformis]
MAARIGILSAVAAPLYPSMEFYPTSPIQTFPPPIQMKPTPLRVRCGITMRLQLPNQSPQNAWSAKGHLQPHRHNLPRRRNPKRFTIVDRDNDDAEKGAVTKTSSPILRQVIPAVVNTDSSKADVATSKPMSEQGIAVVKAQVAASHPPIESPYIPSINADDHHLQSIIPDVFMAYSNLNTSLEELPGYSTAEPYTHVVHIDIADEGNAIKQVSEGCIHHLHLTLPSSSCATHSSRAGLKLTDGQLRTARDFMAEARPLLENNAGVRILVTGPYGRPTDIVSVVACYYSFVSGKSMENVLRFIDAKEDFSSTWKGEVTEDEADKVEEVARGWS